jgi:hypothetical protein
MYCTHLNIFFKRLLAQQDNSRVGKPEEEKETTTNP